MIENRNNHKLLWSIWTVKLIELTYLMTNKRRDIDFYIFSASFSVLSLPFIVTVSNHITLVTGALPWLSELSCIPVLSLIRIGHSTCILSLLSISFTMSDHITLIRSTMPWLSDLSCSPVNYLISFPYGTLYLHHYFTQFVICCV